MDGTRRKPRAARAARLVRGWRLDRNPLRRASDRAETLVLMLLVAAFLAGAPLAALASGAWAHGAAHRAELAQAASRHQVAAVVLTAPATEPWELTSYARARWTAPDGASVTGNLPVAASTRTGATVRVWTFGNGQLSAPPMGDSSVACLTALAEATGVAAVALPLALAGGLARRSLSKRRMAGWDADWQATGPRWTTRA